MTTIEYRKDPVAFARDLLGFAPDQNQAKLLGASQQYVMVEEDPISWTKNRRSLDGAAG